jgi:hypothetical protein
MMRMNIPFKIKAICEKSTFGKNEQIHGAADKLSAPFQSRWCPLLRKE